jgi:23S rRNA (guanosine2251-2'-O)-methyltransferase
VAGRRPVEEAFVARRPARRLLVVPQRRQALERLVLHATSLRIPVVEVEGGTLTAVAGFDGHQGIALVVEPRTWAGIDDILARAVERGEPPFVLVLDSLEDPQNVGTLLRSAEAAGVHGVLFPTHRQAPLTPAAIKASAGAVEHLLLCPVDDLPGALSDLRIRGLRVAAAEADAPLTAAQADLRGPLAIVVGSEGQGLSPVVRRRADVSVRIPMRGAIGSLNAAVAGSILLFAAVAQRDPGGEGADRPRPATFDEIAAASSGLAASDASPDASAEASIDAVAAWPPGADEPVTDVAEAPEAIGAPDDAGGAAEPAPSRPTAPKPSRRSVPAPSATTSTPAAPTPKRARKPAPTTAAQKRSRAAAASEVAGPETPPGARAPRKRTTPAGTASAAGPAPAAETAPTDETPPAAKPPRKRAKAAPPSAKAPATDQNLAADDLLPGGPTDS